MLTECGTKPQEENLWKCRRL